MIRFSRNKTLKTLQQEFNDSIQIHMTVQVISKILVIFKTLLINNLFKLMKFSNISILNH